MLSHVNNIQTFNAWKDQSCFHWTIFDSKRKHFDSYFTLPLNMIRNNLKIRGVLVYGSDGEKSSRCIWLLFYNFKTPLCDIHFKENLKKKLHHLNIKGHIGKEYIYDIFGKQIQSEKVPVVVDCSNAEEFVVKLNWKKLLTSCFKHGNNSLTKPFVAFLYLLMVSVVCFVSCTNPFILVARVLKYNSFGAMPRLGNARNVSLFSSER